MILKKGADDATIIPATRVADVVDPTGAGDSFRAGLLHGISRNFSLEDSCSIGSACASFAIREMGTQNHLFTEKDVFDLAGI
jgi:adenosine kinase